MIIFIHFVVNGNNYGTGTVIKNIMVRKCDH